MGERRVLGHSELRKVANECVAVAQTTTDPGTRACLLAMAQSLLRATETPGDFDSILQDFNDQQMRRVNDAKPVIRQQQTQPDAE